MTNNDYRIPKYNRVRGGLNAVFARPTTCRAVEETTGLADSYMVECGRDQEGQTHCFIERTDEEGVLRLYLPPNVVNTIIRQRDGLGARVHRRKAKENAQARKDAGILPGFCKRK